MVADRWKHLSPIGRICSGAVIGYSYLIRYLMQSRQLDGCWHHPAAYLSVLHQIASQISTTNNSPCHCSATFKIVCHALLLAVLIWLLSAGSLSNTEQLTTRLVAPYIRMMRNAERERERETDRERQREDTKSKRKYVYIIVQCYIKKQNHLHLKWSDVFSWRDFVLNVICEVLKMDIRRSATYCVWSQFLFL
jgi:hypothetical protein